MLDIFVNLKRFDVPRSLGGLCPHDDAVAWIESVVWESGQHGLGDLSGVHLVYLVPEALIPAAVGKLQTPRGSQPIEIGCQGAHWEDIVPGGNFGAFTTCLPATAARNLGCTWAIVGHSEERRAKLQVLQAFDATIGVDDESSARATKAIDVLIHAEVACALNAGLNVLLCVGESAEQRGEGTFEEQAPRIERALVSQVVSGLEGIQEYMPNRRIAIGYEPVWAIGPGRVPPGRQYIGYVSALIKSIVQQHFGFDPVVVYGGGLKQENARMISSIDTIGGGLVALTRFTGDIGFDVKGLKSIITKCLS